MKNLNMTFTIASMIAIAGCAPSGGSSGSSISCEDRLCSLSENITIDQSEVTGASTLATDGIRAQGLLDPIISLTPTLTLVGTLAPPTVNGASVQASDITVNNNKVYMAYNTQGEIQAGAIDVIDISNPNVASLVSQSLYPTADIHKVLVSGGKLYAAGANDNGALLQRITLDVNGKLTSSLESAQLQSAPDANVNAYAGISVITAGSYVYALSGNNGGMSILNSSNLSFSSFTAIPDARDISFDSSASSLYVVTGKTASAEAQVKHLSLTGTALGTGNATLANAQIDEAKSTILTGSNMQIVTAGYAGAKLNCLNGTTLGSAPNPTVNGLSASVQTANAATFGAGYMFVANGEAGVTIYSVNVPLVPIGCTGVSTTYLGRFSLGTAASANNVYYSNGYLVVATGSKGFKIIKVQTSVVSGLLQAL